jgi:hypothetical protein
MIGVATDDESRKPVTSHVVVVALAPRSRWMVVSAGTMSDCCNEKPRPMTAISTRVIVCRVVGASVDSTLAVTAPPIGGHPTASRRDA